MTNYVDEFMKKDPNLQKLGLRPYIGEDLAGNYIYGLRPTAKYVIRLKEGIRVATTSQSNQLSGIIQELLNDRHKYGCPDRVEVPTEEESQRVLILALWTNRPVHLGKKGAQRNKWQAGSKPCYGNQSYMPPLTASQSADALLPESSSVPPCWQPTPEEAESIMEETDPNYDEFAEDELQDQIELEAKESGRTLCPGWWENLLAAIEAKEDLG